MAETVHVEHEVTTYANAVGAFVRNYRQKHGITLESIARLGRKFGTTWSLSSVQAIEGGRASITLPTLLTLALVLGRLSGKPLRLVDLLGATELLDRPRDDGRPVRLSWVDRALSGKTVELTDADLGPTRAAYPYSPSFSLAEQRAAQKLGITPRDLRQQTDDLWGHPLEIEALFRSSPNSTPQARGRVTRLLVDEIKASMKEKK